MEYSSYLSRQGVMPSWLDEPIIASNQPITQINLVERITVSKPGQSPLRSNERRSRRSSSEERPLRIRPLTDYDDKQTTDRRRQRASSEERHRSRSSSRERLKNRIDGIGKHDKSLLKNEFNAGIALVNSSCANRARNSRSSSMTSYHRIDGIGPYRKLSSELNSFSGSETSFIFHKPSSMMNGRYDYSTCEQSNTDRSSAKINPSLGDHLEQSSLQYTYDGRLRTYDGRLRLQDGSLPKGSSLDKDPTPNTVINKKVEDVSSEQTRNGNVIYAGK